MLIKRFCEVTGLPRDTVRFYIRKGLLNPDKGASSNNQYQVFDQRQVERARLIRTAQQLGFSLTEIKRIAEVYEGAGADRSYRLDLLQKQLRKIESQRNLLDQMHDYLSRKIAWIAQGEAGEEPTLEAKASPVSAAKTRATA